jgi:hypothetical protein
MRWKEENESTRNKYSYVKALAMELKRINIKDLFLALVLYEICETKDGIKKITNEDINKIVRSKYEKYLKSKESLLNERWLK